MVAMSWSTVLRLVVGTASVFAVVMFLVELVSPPSVSILVVLKMELFVFVVFVVA
jgi:hypothetical protein